LVNEVIADMIYESAKESTEDTKSDPKQLFYRMQLAPQGSDFPSIVHAIERLRSQAMMAKFSATSYKGINQFLQLCEIRFYEEFMFLICATSSEGGKLIRTLQTQTQEYKGEWQGAQKAKGMESFMASFSKNRG